jgi:hypothetical protein
MYCKLICILYALLCGQNFILVKSGCYNYLVNSREKEIVLRITLVKISEVYAHSPFSVLLVNHHYVDKPLLVSYFSDEPCV